MLERTSRAPGGNPQATAARPDGRLMQATRRSLYLRNTLWGASTLALIAFPGWFIIRANEAGGMLS